MKTKILIVEDNFAKFFCLKHLLESQLKVPVEAKDALGAVELLKTIQRVRPSLMLIRPAGGVTAILSMLQRRQTNRRNTEITLVLAGDLEEFWWNQIEDHAAKWRARPQNNPIDSATQAA